MSGVEGATDVSIEKQVLIPQIRFNVDRAKAAQYGLNAGEITETLETALNGKKVSEAVEGQRRFDVVVRFADEARGSLDALKNVTIDTPQRNANSDFRRGDNRKSAGTESSFAREYETPHRHSIEHGGIAI